MIQDHDFAPTMEGAPENPPIRLILARRPLFRYTSEAKAAFMTKGLQTEVQQKKAKDFDDFFDNEFLRISMKQYAEKIFSRDTKGDDELLNSDDESSKSDTSFYNKLPQEEKKLLGVHKERPVLMQDIYEAAKNPFRNNYERDLLKHQEKLSEEAILKEKFEGVKYRFQRECKYVTGYGQSQDNTILLK